MTDAPCCVLMHSWASGCLRITLTKSSRRPHQRRWSLRQRLSSFAGLRGSQIQETPDPRRVIFLGVGAVTPTRRPPRRTTNIECPHAGLSPAQTHNSPIDSDRARTIPPRLPPFLEVGLWAVWIPIFPLRPNQHMCPQLQGTRFLRQIRFQWATSLMHGMRVRGLIINGTACARHTGAQEVNTAKSGV